MNDLFLFILVVMSILNLILFFKIWKMTNDTSDIKNTLDRLLFIQLPNERRINEAVTKTYTLLLEQKLVLRDDLPSSESEQVKQVTERVIDIVDKNNNKMQKILDDNYLTDVYYIDQLKKDVIDRFLKQISNS